MDDPQPINDSETAPTLRESLRNPNPFDKACRNAVMQDPLGFLRWLDSELFAETQLMGWIDVRAQVDPDARERIGDKLAWLRDPHDPNHPWAVSIEFQTQPRKDTLNRALNYVSQFRLHLICEDPKGAEFLTLPIIVFLTGGPQPNELDLTPRPVRHRRKPLGTRMRALVRVMSQVRADKTLDGIEAGAITPTLLHWVSLMKGGGDSAIMARWGQQARQRIDPEKWANLAITAATFAETSGQKERWIAFLKEWNIVESTVYNEFVAAREARAETKGEAKGQRQTLRDMLSRILRKKWEVEPSETVARKIEAEDNVALLQEWVDEAIFAQSFEAFRKTTKI